MKRPESYPVLILIGLLPLLASCAGPNQLGQTVSLHGRSYAEPFFGPPNYGENPESDSREIAYILKLDKPIRVVMSDGEVEEAGEVQVIDISNGPNLNYSHIPIGNNITVSGRLDEAISGHHRRKVIVYQTSP